MNVGSPANFTLSISAINVVFDRVFKLNLLIFGILMKYLKVLAIAGCFFVAHAASAQEKPLSPAKMSCADFVAVDEVYRPALVYWVAGVDKLGVKETDTMVVDTAHPVGETVMEECKKDPHARFMSKVRSMIKANKIALFDHH